MSDAIGGGGFTPFAELTASQRWAVVRDRDERYDTEFVYGVTSTGIYCRPTCGSRRPRPERIRYFEDPSEAEDRGFRACKRCKPKVDAPSPVAEAVEKACRFLEARLDEPVTLPILADAVGLSVSHLHRVFTKAVGLTPREYQDALRMHRFKEEVRGGRTVSRAAFEAGFGSSRALYDKAGQGLGMTPAAYRAGGKGVAIGFGTAETPVGWLLLASTRRGVCFVSLGDSEQDLRTRLSEEYPRATLVRDAEGVERWIAAILSELDGTPGDAEIPLDLTGTEFQKSVWRAIRSIPRGETRSYRQVASSIGSPGAARAVAGACAANRIALIVPCHRVVRADGHPGGYRWGPERKARMLRIEDTGDGRGAGSGSR
jgi:AraC family transcriptional regulator, regulatory protein of adaptative response / methylated-DNA-[protein]-cysteine methyltransferase